MNEDRLRELLREAPVPAAAGTEQRGLAMVEAAYAERAHGGERGWAAGGRDRPSLPRLALSLAVATLLAALLLSPAGAAVRDWIGDVFSVGVERAKPGLSRVPGGGRLLVRSSEGPWVVQPDGSRRLLGRYREATWSPHGLFVAVAEGRTLTAVEPDGTPRWSLTAATTVRDPRWSPSGYRIAYRAGSRLRVVGADGEGDRVLAATVAALPPAWSPLGLPQLAYVDGSGGLVVRDTESGIALGSSPAMRGIRILEWGAGGAVLEASESAVRLRGLVVPKLADRLYVGTSRRIRLPHGSRVRDAALSPAGHAVAVVVERGGAVGARGEVLVAEGSGPPHRLFSAPGRLGEIAWSPGATHLLISWPRADQWLFVPADGRGGIEAFGGVAGEFAPGATSPGAFPSLEGWCCPWKADA